MAEAPVVVAIDGPAVVIATDGPAVVIATDGPAVVIATDGPAVVIATDGPAVVIAIDGPASAGKGTLARRVAAALGVPHLDTGLLYRATGRRVLDAGGDPGDHHAAAAAALALVTADLARPDLRGPDADRAASLVATVPAVRAALLEFQRRVAAGGAVLDGRDIGTVVCPAAAVKLFVTADVAARARRRWLELGRTVPLDQVEADMRARDTQDADRATAPLRPAADAVVIDTTAMDADAAFTCAMDVVAARLEAASTTVR